MVGLPNSAALSALWASPQLVVPPASVLLPLHRPVDAGSWCYGTVLQAASRPSQLAIKWVQLWCCLRFRTGRGLMFWGGFTLGRARRRYSEHSSNGTVQWATGYKESRIGGGGAAGCRRRADQCFIAARLSAVSASPPTACARPRGRAPLCTSCAAWRPRPTRARTAHSLSCTCRRR